MPPVLGCLTPSSNFSSHTWWSTLYAPSACYPPLTCSPRGPARHRSPPFLGSAQPRDFRCALCVCTVHIRETGCIPGLLDQTFPQFLYQEDAEQIPIMEMKRLCATHLSKIPLAHPDYSLCISQSPARHPPTHSSISPSSQPASHYPPGHLLACISSIHPAFISHSSSQPAIICQSIHPPTQQPSISQPARQLATIH